MVRTAKSIELPVLAPLDREAGQLSRQLAQQLREAIRSGSLRPGESLPATRHLAAVMHVARGTVVEAFEQLVAEGYLDSRRGGSTTVSRELTDHPECAGQKTPVEERLIRALPATAARYANVAAAMYPLPSAPFAISVPAGDIRPDDTWRKLGNRLRATRAGGPAGYGDPQGLKSLRMAISDYVRKTRSVVCEPEQIIITSGTQQGLYLACQVLLGETDQTWVEDPAYLGITAILENAGRPARSVRVPVDENGLIVSEGIRLAPNARAAFVTPSHQYPLGMPMSMPRREALLNWARTRNAWIIEDDYDSELRYAGHPFPSLQGQDSQRVIYLGTFSKILFPSLRLGYLIAPADLVSAFCGARIVMDRHPATADQHVLAAFIAEGHLDRHVRRIRGIYADSRSTLIQLLEHTLPAELATVQPIDQGAHLLVWLHDSIDDQAVAREAAAQGVAVRALSPTYAAESPRTRRGLILGFGGFTAEKMSAAAATLSAILLDHRSSH
ncbi:PLP-dependent aminotransferase family protein [Achromobacter spanius]|uniref:MocR-like pyridoxine biosynthesis transcription factor PdxR n=1 Tax=Achromobacter spanius TaxID=217203 RepID=UPI003819ADAF